LGTTGSRLFSVSMAAASHAWTPSKQASAHVRCCSMRDQRTRATSMPEGGPRLKSCVRRCTSPVDQNAKRCRQNDVVKAVPADVLPPRFCRVTNIFGVSSRIHDQAQAEVDTQVSLLQPDCRRVARPGCELDWGDCVRLVVQLLVTAVIVRATRPNPREWLDTPLAKNASALPLLRSLRDLVDRTQAGSTNRPLRLGCGIFLVCKARFP
jgi:hypothetical protein